MLATPRALALRARVRVAMHRTHASRPAAPGAAAAAVAGGGGGDSDGGGDASPTTPLASGTGPSSSTTAIAAPGTSAGGRRSAYTTLSAPHSHTYEIKKSKFVTTAWPVTSPDEAARLVAAAADPAASHNCWALACGPAARCSDDGEPAGTAGRPILAAIEAEGVDGLAVLVTRYRGGPKLGAGGLARAYGAAARECLRGAARVAVEPTAWLTIGAPLADVGAVYAVVAGAGGAVEGEAYGPDGAVSLRATAPAVAIQALVDGLAGRTAGRAAVVVEDED
jgi:putative IMPACT (imprinted ancient) family translation regulator